MNIRSNKDAAFKAIIRSNNIEIAKYVVLDCKQDPKIILSYHDGFFNTEVKNWLEKYIEIKEMSDTLEYGLGSAKETKVKRVKV